MAIYNPPPKTPAPQDDDPGASAIKLARNYMFRQYWSLKWWLISAAAFMSIYTIHFERWLPFIGLTGLMSFFMVMMGLMACGALMNTEFLKAVRAEQLGTDYDWTKVRYAAWGLLAGNLVMFYWLIVMSYVTWFAENPVNIQ